MNVNKEQFKKNFKNLKKALKNCQYGLLLIAPRSSGKTEMITRLIKKKLTNGDEDLINYFSNHSFLIKERLGEDASKINFIGDLMPAHWTFVEEVTNKDITTCKKILSCNGKKVFLLTPSEKNEELIMMLSEHLDVLRFDYKSTILPYSEDVLASEIENIYIGRTMLNQKFALLSGEIDKLPKL